MQRPKISGVNARRAGVDILITCLCALFGLLPFAYLRLNKYRFGLLVGMLLVFFGVYLEGILRVTPSWVYDTPWWTLLQAGFVGRGIVSSGLVVPAILIHQCYLIGRRAIGRVTKKKLSSRWSKLGPAFLPDSMPGRRRLGKVCLLLAVYWPLVINWLIYWPILLSWQLRIFGFADAALRLEAWQYVLIPNAWKLDPLHPSAGVSGILAALAFYLLLWAESWWALRRIAKATADTGA